MSVHPYWSYGPDTHGVPCPPEEFAKALDEGRRAFALELAVKSLENATGLIGSPDYTDRARFFEAYLKGGSA